MTRNRSFSPLPLYFTVMMELQEKILSGDWPGGAHIPGEVELAKTMGVSVITIRQAMAQLVRDGYIERHRARGSFVSRDVPIRHRITLDIEVDDLIHVSPDTRFKVIDFGTIQAPPSVAQKLRLAKPERVKRVVRVRMQADRPLESIVTYVAAALGRKIPERAFAELALPRILRKHAAIDVSEVNHTISAVLADAEVASQIETPLGSPLLMIEREYVAADAIVAVSVGYYRSDLFRYELRLKHRAMRKPGQSRNGARRPGVDRQHGSEGASYLEARQSNRGKR